MLDGIPSRTAAMVAAARGLGALLPAHVQLADDPYGLRFVGGALPRGRAATAVGWALRLPLIRPWILYMQVRTRILDDVVRAFARAGGRQIVLLGAGYDCRALRLAPELGGAAVYEVDHPATQGHKREVLAADGSAARYVTWDFERRPMAELPAALAAAGHDAAAPTLTLWEGVTMYLTEAAIEASVAAIAAYSAPGSSLGVTYFTRAEVERPSLVTRLTAGVVQRAGEPWRFGWDPAALPAWLAARGFALDRDVAMADEARALLPGRWSAGVGHRGRRVAVAERVATATL